MSITGGIVLCGGTSSRFGGNDKTAESVAGVAILDRVLLGLPEAWPVVCVGEARPTARPTTWAREHPAGGGPLAGIAAGMASLDTALIVVIAGDLPFAGPWAPLLVDRLIANPSVEAVAARQPDGRPQLLFAAYRRDALASATAGEMSGAGVYRTLGGLTVDALGLAAAATFDVDSPEDLLRARQGHDSRGH